MSVSSLSSLSDNEDVVVRRRNEEKLNAFEKYNDAEFKIRFRLSKETVHHLCSLIESNIQPITNRNRAIQAVDEILIALRYFATGTYQKVIGDVFNVQQPTVHRIVHRVATEIAKLKDNFIKMPTPSEQASIAQEFYAIAGMPRVIGAVDCTHIKIKSSGGQQAETFRNRKGFFSINVQMVCDTRLMVHNIIARWPGSVHDSTIFNDSPLCAQLERGDYGNMFLLGDSGYPCRNFLLTPILNPSTESQQAYNRAQIATRNPVERLFGVMKKRFPCLQIGLLHKLENIPTIIVACACLHNIALSRQDLFDDDTEEATREDDIVELAQDSRHNENFAARNMIIHTIKHDNILLHRNTYLLVLLFY